MSFFRVHSPQGETVDKAVPAHPGTHLNFDYILEYGLGAVWVMKTFGAEFSEPHIRFAWQHRHAITRTTFLSDAFISSVSLTGDDGRKIPLPWHPDTFTALYVLNLYTLNKYEEAETIAAATPPTNPTACHIIERILDNIHASQEVPLYVRLEDEFDLWVLDEFPANMRNLEGKVVSEPGSLPPHQPTPPPYSTQTPTQSQ